MQGDEHQAHVLFLYPFSFSQVSHFCGACRGGIRKVWFFLFSLFFFFSQILDPRSAAERLQPSLTSPFASLNNNNNVFFCVFYISNTLDIKSLPL